VLQHAANNMRKVQSLLEEQEKANGQHDYRPRALHRALLSPADELVIAIMLLEEENGNIPIPKRFQTLGTLRNVKQRLLQTHVKHRYTPEYDRMDYDLTKYGRMRYDLMEGEQMLLLREMEKTWDFSKLADVNIEPASLVIEDLDEVVWQLVKLANVKIQDKEGRTALHWAAEGGKVDIVQLLLAKGADINIKDKNGQAAKDQAVNKGKENGQAELKLAVTSRNEMIIKLLVNKGVHVGTENGQRELKWAVDK